jgi:polysaccharide biosynthesis/export protein
MIRLLLALAFYCVFFTNAHAQALKPGDALQISVWQDPKLDRTVVIGPTGMIGFPLAGQVRAGGLSPRDLEAELARRLQKNYAGRLDVTVSLAPGPNNAIEKEVDKKPRVYVTGEVLRPGPYIIEQKMNVVQALSLAGGVGTFAAPQRIQVHRKIRGLDSIFVFDFNAYKAGTDTIDNIDLRAGDIIIVPERGLFE